MTYCMGILLSGRRSEVGRVDSMTIEGRRISTRTFGNSPGSLAVPVGRARAADLPSPREIPPLTPLLLLVRSRSRSHLGRGRRAGGRIGQRVGEELVDDLRHLRRSDE